MCIYMCIYRYVYRYIYIYRCVNKLRKLLLKKWWFSTFAQYGTGSGYILLCLYCSALNFHSLHFACNLNTKPIAAAY